MILIHPDGYDVELFEDGTWARVRADTTSGRSGSAVNDIAGFRGQGWGTSKQEVRANRVEAPVVETENALQYTAFLNGEPIIELFIFHAGRLARGKCISAADYVNDNNYLKSFEALKGLLAEKYGTPEEDNEYWTNDLFQDDPGSWGTAVSSGHLARFVRWVKPSGDVWLALKGENYTVELGLEYNSAALEAEVGAAAKRALLDEI